MGLWLTDKAIQKIVTRLDFKFSDTGPNSGIQKIRTTARKDRFNPLNSPNPGLHLHKIARRMRIWGDSGSGTLHSLRWWGFLKNLHQLPNNSTGNPDAAEDIKAIILAALNDDPACRAIKFTALDYAGGPGVRVDAVPIPVPNDPAHHIKLIVLQTPQHDNSITEPDPGPIDQDPGGEDA